MPIEINSISFKLGGGGYTMRNVSRCWCFDTAVALDEPISNCIPPNEYFKFFGPSYRLHIKPDPELNNHNDKRTLNNIIMQVFENLRNIEPVPSVHFQQTPLTITIPDSPDLDEELEEEPNFNAVTTPPRKSPEPDFIIISDDDD
jgi:histone deacetylase 1/2